MTVFANNIIGPWTWNKYEYLSVNGLVIMLAVVMFFIVISNIITKITNIKPPKLPLYEGLNLEHYTLGFEGTHVNVKKISLKMRVFICIMSALLVITPLNYLLMDLNYSSFWAWIPL